MPGHLIRRMHQAAGAIFDAQIAKHGYHLTPVQYAALTVIDAAPGLDQASLAAAIAYDRVTIGGVIDRLELKGFVRREIAKGDRRSRRLYIEASGKAILDGITPVVRAAQDDILKGLSDRESATLKRLLRKALDAVGDVRRVPSRTTQ